MFQDMWNPFLKKRALDEVNTRRHRSSTFTEPLRKAPEMKDFLTTFYKNVYTPAKKNFYNQELKTHSDSLKVHYDILVPTMVSYEDFWQRYEWRCDINRVTNELRQADAVKANDPPESLSQTPTSQSKSSPTQATPFTTSTPKTAVSGWTNWLSESPLVKSDPINEVPQKEETMAQVSKATNEMSNTTKVSADSSKQPSDSRSSSKQGDTTKGPLQEQNKRKANASNETKSKLEESNTTADSSASAGPLFTIREAIKDAMQPTTTETNAEPSPGSSSKQMNPKKEVSSMEATKTMSADPFLPNNATPASPKKTGSFLWPGSLSMPSNTPKKENEVPSVEATKTMSADPSLPKNATPASADMRASFLWLSSSSKPSTTLKKEEEVTSMEATKAVSADPSLPKIAPPASPNKRGNFLWPSSSSKPSNTPEKAKEVPSMEATKANSADIPVLKNASQASPDKTSHWFGKKQSNVATVAPVVSPENSKGTPLETVDKTASPIKRSGFLKLGVVVMAVFLSFAILIFFFSPLVSPWRQMAANGLCGPVPPGTVLDSTTTLLVSGQSMAPWWAPDPLKEQSFALFCGNRPRVHLKWQIVGTKKKLHLTATNINNGKTILSLQGLASVELLASQIRTQTLKHKREDRSAPWIAADL
jgi:hypothetical protein